MFGALRFAANLLLALVLLAVLVGALATGLGAVASRGWERFDLTEGVEEPTWAWIDGRPVHYRALGPETGPVMVLLHGCYVEGGATWRETARGLSGMGVRVISIDLPGFGNSTRDPSADHTLAGQALTVARLLNELRVRQATVAGHGWGGAVALQLAHTQPQFVERLVLVSPVVYADPAPSWAPLAHIPYVGRAAAWAWEAGGPLWRPNREGVFHDASRLTDAYRHAALTRARIYGTVEALVAMAPVVSNRGLHGALGEVAQPTLVICGARDPLVSRDHCERLVVELPHAELAAVDEAGHFVHLEREAEVTRLLAEFHAR